MGTKGKPRVWLESRKNGSLNQGSGCGMIRSVMLWKGVDGEVSCTHEARSCRRVWQFFILIRVVEMWQKGTGDG